MATTLSQAMVSPQRVVRRRKLADTMLQQGSDTSPVGHPLGALARVIQGTMGGYMAGKADRDEQAGQAAYSSRLKQALSGQSLDMPGMADLASDPWSTPEGNALAQSYYKQLHPEPKDLMSVGKGSSLYDPNSGEWVAPPQGGAAAQPDFTEQLSLTNQVLRAPGVQRFNETLPLLRSMGESIQDNRSATDMDFIYGAALTMSPDGRVTDQDAQLMSDNQSVRDRIRGEIQAAFRGEGKLSPQARRALYDLALRRTGQYRKQAEEEMGYYGRIAQPGGFQLPELGAMPEALPPLPPEAAVQQPPPQQETIFDDPSQIPEGAIVEDDQTGQKLQMRNGQLVPLQ